MPRTGRPRISIGIQESKTLALYNSGRTLLGGHDYEAFSVAELANGAHCSVGAFYVRFQDKEAFLGFVISESFNSAMQSLAVALVSGDSIAVNHAAKARLAVSLLSDQFADSEFAGVVRAAIKLGFSNEALSAPFADFRSAATDLLAEWLADSRSKHIGQTRVALRVILGALTDSVLSEEGASALRASAFRDALVYFLDATISGASRSGGKIDPEKSRKKSGKGFEQISALEKPSKKALPNSSRKSNLPKRKLTPPSGRTRKV